MGGHTGRLTAPLLRAGGAPMEAAAWGFVMGCACSDALGGV
jgi:hypothetical protein